MSRSRQARSLAALALGCSEADLGREPGGRPTAPGGLYLALSHARNIAAVAVASDGPVGVDVEPQRELPAAELARHWFDADEAEWVKAHPEGFLLLWTQKEAVGKALGTGLRGGGLRRVMPRNESRELQPLPGVDGMHVAAWRHQELVIAVACEVPAHLAVFSTD